MLINRPPVPNNQMQSGLLEMGAVVALHACSTERFGVLFLVCSMLWDVTANACQHGMFCQSYRLDHI